MTHLWIREIKHHRIARSETTPLGDDLQQTLGELLVKMDIARPMWLDKHAREWEQFGQTAFSRDHFVESVSFDRLEIERIDSDVKKVKSSDPRNG